MAVLNWVFEVEQDSDYTTSPFEYWNQDATGLGDPDNYTPVNFTGWNATMLVNQSQSAASANLLTLTNSPGGGIVFTSTSQSPTFPAAPPSNQPNGYQITVTAAQSAGIAPGTYYYNLYIIAIGGSPRVLWQKGPFVVTPAAF